MEDNKNSVIENTDFVPEKGLGPFLKASYEEVTQHTTWPARNELINNSLLVLVASVLFALFICVLDFGFENLMKLFYSI